jgi:hypothetical protein
MANKRLLKGLFIGLTIFGLGLIALGIYMPYLFQSKIDAALDNLWMQKDGYSSWGELPGKLGMKMVRSFLLYNVTNPDEILLGSTPKVVELPAYPTQEYNKWIDWSYVSSNLTNTSVTSTQKESDYIAYHTQLFLPPLKNNGTYIAPTSPTTLINVPWYSVLQSYIKGSPVLYALWALHDMQVTLSSELLVEVVGYTLYWKFLANATLAESYLAAVGLNSTASDSVQQDQSYGWGSVKATKLWVQAVLDVNASGSCDEGACDVINNYFQLPTLTELIEPPGEIFSLVEEILEDMAERYGTTNATQLAALQWANASVTRNMPLNLTLTLPPNVPFASFWALNQSLGFIPEMYWFERIVLKSQADFSSNAQDLLQVEYTYPNVNEGSIINIENLAFFLTNVLTNPGAVMQR